MLPLKAEPFNLGPYGPPILYRSSVDNKYYLIICPGDTIQKYDVFKDEWFVMTKYPQNLKYHTAVLDPIKEMIHIFAESYAVYDIKQNQWEIKCKANDSETSSEDEEEGKKENIEITINKSKKRTPNTSPSSFEVGDKELSENDNNYYVVYLDKGGKKRWKKEENNDV